MKRNVRLMVLAILALFMMPLVVNAVPLVSFAEPQVQEEFVLSADGDESTDSIYDFNETLPDDVMFYPDGSDFSTSDHYAESFADVSDWNLGDCEAGDIFTTDGDVASFEVGNNGGNDYDYVFSNVPSGVYPYYEFIYRVNVTTNAVKFVTWSADNRGGSQTQWSTPPVATTDWQTFKVYDGDSIECVGFTVYTTTGAPGPVKLDVDYLRSGDETEMGWQHDGSTTEGTSTDGDAGTTYTSSTDGDRLTLNMTWNSGAFWSGWRIGLDTTATVADIERDHYPFYEIQFTCTTAGSMSSTHSGIGVYYDGHETFHNTFVADGSSVTLRGNMKAETDTDTKKYFEFFGYLNGAGDSIEFVVDWTKIYSIANFTVTNMFTATTDYFYVDSGTLQASITSTTFDQTWEGLRLDYDPTLAVNTATYNVWNMTSSDFDDALWNHYIGSWQGHSAAGETRGGFASGTLTDFEVLFWTSSELSAIKFIEDGTAPVISDFWIVPYTPTEEDNVTLAIYETDAGVGTYTVIFNAVDYPAGFVDIDMDAVESSNKDGLWSYTIDSSDLPAGYYVFEVIASDGTNEGTELTIFEVIDVTDNIFYLLFLSTDMWGYLGPFALVFIGYVLTKKDKFLGVLWFVVECLFMSQYFLLVAATPDYWWHIIILLFGGLLTCVYPLWDR